MVRVKTRFKQISSDSRPESSRNPLRNFLRTRSRCLILPVPVVFLLLAFTDHPNLRILAEGKPQAEHTFFWMWRVTFPHLLHTVCVLFLSIPKELVPFVMARPCYDWSLVEVNQAILA